MLDQVHLVARPHLGADEPIVAVLPFTYTMPRHRWVLFLVSYLLVLFTRHYWALVLTDRRLIIVDCGTFGPRPRAIAAAYPRADVRLAAHQRWLMLDRIDIEAGGVTTRYRAFRSRRVLRECNDAFIAAIQQPAVPSSSVSALLPPPPPLPPPPA
jgi:hypothetical protein